MKSRAQNLYYTLVKLIRLHRIFTHLSRKYCRKHVNVHFFIQDTSKNLMFKKCLLNIELGGPFGGPACRPFIIWSNDAQKSFYRLVKSTFRFFDTSKNMKISMIYPYFTQFGKDSLIKNKCLQLNFTGPQKFFQASYEHMIYYENVLQTISYRTHQLSWSYDKY